MQQTLDQLGLRYKTDKASAGHDYLRHYEFFIQSLRNEEFLLIEIGGLNGASLMMWRDYCPYAQVLCLDIDPGVKKFEGGRIKVEIGNAASPEFLDTIKRKYGIPRLVIDDGSHRWDHQRIAFESLFPTLAPGGLFIVEDLHTSYENGFSGGDEQPFSDYLKRRVDYIHLRGEKRREYEKFYSKQTVDLAKDIDMVAFVPRSCIIRKREPRRAEVPAAGAGAHTPSEDRSRTYPVARYTEAEFTLAYPKSERFVVIPAAQGSLSRESKTGKLSIPEQYTANVKNAICLPRQVIIRDEAILPDSFRRLNFKLPHVQLDRLGADMFRPKISVEPNAIIGEPCFYLDGEHADHFGHFTLEVLSRLWTFNRHDFSSFLFITSARPSDRHLDWLAPFGIKETQLRYFREPVLCRDLMVSSQGYILESSVTDSAHEVWNRIGEFYDDGTQYDKLYVSRSRWSKQRNLLNEQEVEDAMRAMGFQVIYPETMSVPEQVRAFRNARLIVGPSGSGLYNCIYCQRTGTRIILAAEGFVTLNDSLVNARTHSNLMYITGTSVDRNAPGMLGDWTIDPALVKDVVAKMA